MSVVRIKFESSITRISDMILFVILLLVVIKGFIVNYFIFYFAIQWLLHHNSLFDLLFGLIVLVLCCTKLQFSFMIQCCGFML